MVRRYHFHVRIGVAGINGMGGSSFALEATAQAHEVIVDSSKIERVLDWKADTHWKRLAEIMLESDLRNLTEKQK